MNNILRDPNSICHCCNRRGFVGLLASSFLVPLYQAVAEQLHVVKKGETLYGLSRRYEVEVADLARANGLTTKTKIKIGQKIYIPEGKPSITDLPYSLRRDLNRPRVRSRRWKYIVVHHSATSSGTLKGMDEYHSKVRHMENGLAYHFVIGNGKGMPDGEIGIGHRWEEQLHGGHLSSEGLNEVSLGICLVGNFEKAKPTAAQMESLASLTHYLIHRCSLSVSAVQTHQQINTVYTRCPGRHFPSRDLLARLGG